MNHSSFDDLIRQKANNHEAPVPDTAWQNIMPEEKKRRRPFFWLFFFPLLMAGTGFWIYSGQSSKKQLTASYQAANAIQPEANNTQKGKAETFTKLSGDSNQKQKTTTIAKPTNSRSLTNTIPEFSAHSTDTNDGKPGTPKVAASDSPKKPGSIPATQKNTASGEQVAITKEYSNSGDASNNRKPIDSYNAADNQKGNLETVGYTEHQKQPGLAVIAFDGLSSLALNTDNNDLADENSKRAYTEQTLENAVVAETLLDTLAQETAKSSITLPKTSNQKWRLVASSTLMAIIPGQNALFSLTRSGTLTGSPQTYYTATDIKFSYQPSLAFSLGIQKSIGKKWALGAGLQYQQIKENISLKGIEIHVDTQYVNRLSSQNGAPVLIRSAVVDSSSGTRTIEAQNSYRFISVPLYVQYKLIQNRSAYLALQIGAVVNVSGKYNNRIQGNFEKTFSPSAQNFNHWGFDAQISLLAAKKLGNRFEVFAAPTLRLNKTKPTDKNLTNSYLNQVGLSLGISYGLGR